MDSLVKGYFQFIVDTGCSTSCTPHKEDFEELVEHKSPITLHRITGDQTCTQGGFIKVQTINTKGEVVTLRTPGFYNPHQDIRLFSPQAHFYIMHNKKGSLNLSWANACLDLPNCGKVPLCLDKVTFMTILTCFHKVDDTLLTLASQFITDEANPQLSSH